MKEYEVTVYAVTPYILNVSAESSEEAVTKAEGLFGEGFGLPLTLETAVEYSRVKEIENANV
jgi:hypothetical protein